MNGRSSERPRDDERHGSGREERRWKGKDHQGESRARLVPSALARTRPRDWVVRFAFGAGVSALAGVISIVAGAGIGGVFLAFPAILLASLTLVAKEEGRRQAREEAAGATFGTIGMIGFAVSAGVLAGRWPLWAVLGAGAVVWLLLAFGSVAAFRRWGRS